MNTRTASPARTTTRSTTPPSTWTPATSRPASASRPRWPASPSPLQGALVVRHVVSPSFSLGSHINNQTGTINAQPSNFNFTLNPEVDLGAAASDYGVKLVAEAHNLTSTNGGGDTFHVGAEYNAFKYIVPRIGYDNNAFVYGLGIDLSILRINVAASTNYQERAAADLSLNFGF